MVIQSIDTLTDGNDVIRLQDSRGIYALAGDDSVTGSQQSDYIY